jgi:hypothetical protein
MVSLLALAHDRACEAELAAAIDADLDVPPLSSRTVASRESGWRP